MLHLTAEGEYIEEWGSQGYGPLEFEGLHAIAVDSQGKIYVGDRTNNRLQVLSPSGELLAIWTHWGRPSGIRIRRYALCGRLRVKGRNRPIWLQSRLASSIYVGTLDGEITDFIPDPNPHDATSFPEGIGIDDNGVIWGASVGDQKVTKYMRN